MSLNYVSCTVLAVALLVLLAGAFWLGRVSAEASGAGSPPEMVAEQGRGITEGQGAANQLPKRIPGKYYPVIQRLKDEKLDGDIKTVVGGAPVTEAFARDIGADAYGFDAANAVGVVKRLSGVV